MVYSFKSAPLWIIGVAAFVTILTIVYLEPATYIRTLRHTQPHDIVQGSSGVVDGHAAIKSLSDGPSKAIVAATTQGTNTSWMGESFPNWQHHVYSVDDPSATLQARNRGHEGSAYLTYILDHYQDESHNTLADYVVFSHNRRYEWHNDDPMYDAVSILNRLNFTRVDQEGYINLRCVWKPGCDEDVRMKPTIDFVPSPKLNNIHFSTLLGRAMTELFPNDPLPAVVRNPCCAQFAVSKARILSLPRSRYEHFRNFLYEWHFKKYLYEVSPDTIYPINVTLPIVEDVISGNLMENMWHMLFGKRADNCMTAGECYCLNFGICNLNCPEPGSCKGRYYPPPALNHQTPEGWPEKGQGTKGWPVDNWWLMDV